MTNRIEVIKDFLRAIADDFYAKEDDNGREFGSISYSVNQPYEMMKTLKAALDNPESLLSRNLRILNAHYLGYHAKPEKKALVIMFSLR